MESVMSEEVDSGVKHMRGEMPDNTILNNATPDHGVPGNATPDNDMPADMENLGQELPPEEEDYGMPVGAEVGPPHHAGSPEKRMSEEQPPNSKTMKYDRQLRLWGEAGQQRLELASVCLFNATAIGCETLKSLVLPGVGTITIVDDKLVTKEAVQANFFLGSEDVGKNRGQCVATTLGEMNQDVKISAVTDLSSNLSLIKSFSLIIISNTNATDHAEVSQIAWDRGIPVLIVNCIGMYAEVRIVVKEHCVFNTKPDNPLPDLRLDTPFTELIEYYQNIEFSGYSDTEHAHIPFIVILLKCLDQWRSDHGIIPQNYREKTKFKELITSMKRKEDEENFDEACSYVNKCVVKQSLSSNVQAVFNDDMCSQEHAFSQFWITASAVKHFYTVKGVLPLSGVLDDMTADSQSYIALQKLYHNKALSDAELVASYVEEILKKKDLPETFISRDYIEGFSRNARFMRIIRTSPVQGVELEKVQAALSGFDDSTDASHVWLLFKALHTFYKTYDRYPGNTDGSVKTDEQLLLTILITIQKQYKLAEVHPEGLVKDFVRYGGVELPSVAAYCGGVAAHEAIKLLTFQYVPLDNCLVYNGGSQHITVFKF